AVALVTLIAVSLLSQQSEARASSEAIAQWYRGACSDRYQSVGATRAIGRTIPLCNCECASRGHLIGISRWSPRRHDIRERDTERAEVRQRSFRAAFRCRDT